MTYEITIKTYEKQYTERVYGAIETCDRVAEIVKCDNVQVVEIMDTQTGAIMLEIVDRMVMWLDLDFTVLMVNEIFSRN